MRLTILLLAFFFSCSSTDMPADILPPEKMKPVLFDMMRADEFATNYIANDSTKKIKDERIKLYEKVFVLHKTNKEQFYNSFKYYQEHPDLNKQLFDSLMTYGNRVKEKGLLPKAKPQLNPN